MCLKTNNVEKVARKGSVYLFDIIETIFVLRFSYLFLLSLSSLSLFVLYLTHP